MVSYKMNSSDTDLVELAGYRAYLKHEADDIIEVNGNEYEVVNDNYNNPTGLDAFTVQNLDTFDFTVVFVGTDVKQLEDVKTDIFLLSDTNVPQLEAAKLYYEEMDKKYGVDSVTGNSLGGALANRIGGVEYPEVRTVTYNPALLPKHQVESDKDYPNITNYFGEYDILTGSLISLGLDDRIPGAKHEIHNGIPSGAGPFSTIASNHTGYLRDTNGQYYEIRPEGGPGSGKIFIDADEHIVTSIWTGKPLYGGGDHHPIDITPEALEVLANGLENAVIGRLAKVKQYLGNAMEIIIAERAKRKKRITTMQEAFDDLVVEEIGDAVFEDITWMGNMLKSELRYWHSVLNQIEQKAQYLNILLNSPPVEVLEFLTKRDINVSSLVAEARRQLNNIENNIDELTEQFRYIITEIIPQLLHAGFQAGAEQWYDTVVEKMNAHFEIVEINTERLHQQINRFKRQVHETGNQFAATDLSIAEAITRKQDITSNPSIAPLSERTTLETSPYLKSRMLIKEIQLDASFQLLKVNVNSLIIPVVHLLHQLTLTIEHTLESISAAVKMAPPHLYFTVSLPGKFIAAFSNFDEKVHGAVNNVMEPVDTLASRVEGIRDGLQRLQLRLPAILDRFRPYIEHAIFDNYRYHEVYLYNHAALALLKETDILFNDINTQLANEKAKAIDELLLNGEEIDKNYKLLSEQVELGTLY
ncbi:hypothetical protein JCM21714_4118 [Gracilibacillus boraciitolerans JCM 21714]|uniref:DUF2974 domain-containing protein n=1 Tax=Gracilibacillus boraciitolerans JCM 21714 TaxID=1298598 RepID=W4VQ18_9BACI|nr:hypothetical protein [Gracilibacillus boraciitolerans]GAE94918.1 hypothetical protein JCM21714_4118 [Gracilibacillus boraciitolerans JCM 21714]